MSQRRICAHTSSADAVLPEVQPRDKTISKEGADPPRGCGLSDLCHVLRMCVTKAM